jgi:hypothetical protein
MVSVAKVFFFHYTEFKKFKKKNSGQKIRTGDIAVAPATSRSPQRHRGRRLFTLPLRR